MKAVKMKMKMKKEKIIKNLTIKLIKRQKIRII